MEDNKQVQTLGAISVHKGMVVTSRGTVPSRITVNIKKYYEYQVEHIHGVYTRKNMFETLPRAKTYHRNRRKYIKEMKQTNMPSRSQAGSGEDEVAVCWYKYGTAAI